MEVHFEDLKEEDLREVYDLCMETFQESFAFEEIEETFQLCRNDAHYRFLVGKSQGKVVAYTSINIFHNLFDGRRPIMTLWYVASARKCGAKAWDVCCSGRSKRSQGKTTARSFILPVCRKIPGRRISTGRWAIQMKRKRHL